MTHAAADRSADGVEALWLEMAAGRRLYLVVRSGRRDIPVSVGIGEDGRHSILAVSPDPIHDHGLLARLLVEGRPIGREAYMRWSGDLAREGALWRATKRLGRTAGRYGFSGPEAEFGKRKKGLTWGGGG